MNKVPELLRIAAQKGHIGSWEDLADEFYYQEVDDEKAHVEALMELESIIAQTREKYMAGITARLKQGCDVQGFKLGKPRKTRSIPDVQKAELHLREHGIPHESLYVSKFKGVPDIEKLLKQCKYSPVEIEAILTPFVTVKYSEPKVEFKD